MATKAPSTNVASKGKTMNPMEKYSPARLTNQLWQGVTSGGSHSRRDVPIDGDSRDPVHGYPLARPNEVMPLISVDRGPSPPLDSFSCQLLHHFDQNIATKLAWVDGPENPWRQIILPLSHASPIVRYSLLAMSSEDLTHKYTVDRPYFHHLKAQSLYYRDRVLSHLPQHLERLLKAPISLDCANEARFVLATVLLLYNLELLSAKTTQWRLHIQGARAIIQWKLQAIGLHRPPDVADNFLRYEYYFTAVFNGLTTFDATYDVIDDIPINDKIAVFGDFVRIMHCVTRAERINFSGSPNTETTRVEDVVGEIETARDRALQLNHIIRFQYPDARHDFEHLTHMYYHASLIYSHRVLSDPAPSQELIQASRDAILDHLSHLIDLAYFAHDLVWPLFVCGTECRGSPDKQDTIERALLGVIRLSDKITADSNLEALGYTPELSRNRSTWQVVFMVFILASVPYGLSTTMLYSIAGGGSANMIWGWIVVSLIMLCVAASLAEVTSVYPTAGGVYYQTFALSPVKYRRVAAWICGWSFIAGNITITLAVNFATALFLIESLNVFTDATGVGITEDFQAYQTYLIFLGITLICHVIPAFGNKWLTHLETFAIFWTLVGVTAIIITILVVASNGRHTAKYVFTDFSPQSGWPDGWSFCIGLLQAAYALSATGMITSMCEEVRAPAIQVPKAIVGGLILNALAGLAFLIPIAFVLPDISYLANLAPGQPVPPIFKAATGNSAGAFCLLIPLLILGIICGVGCVTAASRSVWAFARDGAIPGSKWFKKVEPRLDNIPLNAMLLGMIIELLLGLIYFGSTAADGISRTAASTLDHSVCSVTSSVSVSGLDFSLPRTGLYIPSCLLTSPMSNLAWTCLAIPLFSMPTFMAVTQETMNYASVVFVGFFIISAVWYWVWGYQNYAGPPTEEGMEGAHTD
ncbi:unnamed protein product [Aspergillus oryzae var. brunneus]|uniref:Unnamed protein product n=1 Tax=Aspergillus oryzae var. brunneus TaxID=332754 RepID=A0ABQ6LF01_ASPOZ|nr:unnamed protein product [Aspergillus oryzae var. brunneus]